MTRRPSWDSPVIALLGGLLLLLGCPPPSPPALPKAQSRTQTQTSPAQPTQDMDLKDLADSNPETRLAAIMTLAERLGSGTAPPDAWAALEAVLLEDPDRHMRSEALRAIGNLPPEKFSDEVVTALAKAAGGDEDNVIRYGASAFLGQRAKQSVLVLAKILHDASQPESLRLGAANGLSRCGTAGLEPLAAALQDPSVQIRLGVVSGLGELRDKCEPVASALVRALGDEAEGVRLGASNVLEELGPPAVPHLLLALEDERELVRQLAVRALSYIRFTGEPSAPITPALLRALEDQARKVRFEAATGLAGPAHADRVLPLLQEGLEYEAEDDRAHAASAFAELGPDAKAAIPALLRALEDKAQKVRFEVALALAKVAPIHADRVLPLLRQALEHDAIYDSDEAKYDRAVRRKAFRAQFLRARAASALGALGPRAKAAIPALEKAARDSSSDVREQAAEALKKIRG